MGVMSTRRTDSRRWQRYRDSCSHVNASGSRSPTTRYNSHRFCDPNTRDAHGPTEKEPRGWKTEDLGAGTFLISSSTVSKDFLSILAAFSRWLCPSHSQ